MIIIRFTSKQNANRCSDNKNIISGKVVLNVKKALNSEDLVFLL